MCSTVLPAGSRFYDYLQRCIHANTFRLFKSNIEIFHGESLLLCRIIYTRIKRYLHQQSTLERASRLLVRNFIVVHIVCVSRLRSYPTRVYTLLLYARTTLQISYGQCPHIFFFCIGKNRSSKLFMCIFSLFYGSHSEFVYNAFIRVRK